MGLGAWFTRATHARALGPERFPYEVVVGGETFHQRGVYGGALGIPGAWRATMLIADLIGQFPWDAYEGNVELNPRPALLEQPSPPDVRVTTLSSLAIDYLWHGNAIEIIASRNAFGVPLSTLPVPAWKVGVGRNREDGRIKYAIGGREFDQADIIHTKGPCEPGALRGMGVLELHLATLNIARAQQEQASAISEHGIPTGVLKSDNPDLTPIQAAGMKSAWLNSQKTRTVAVINSSTSFEAIAWNPEEMQMVESRRYTLHELALVFGVPPYFLGVPGASNTYTNQESEGINLLRHTMGGHIARFEQTRSTVFPIGISVKANLDVILRTDTKTRYETYRLGLDGGWLTLDEIRALENRAPLTSLTDADEFERLAVAVQKLYLGVEGNVLLSQEEGRALLNKFGANLPEKMPKANATPEGSTP